MPDSESDHAGGGPDNAVHMETHRYNGKMQVLVPGMERHLVSFCGRPDTGTVTMYAVDPDAGDYIPLLECEAGHFETFLEQASGALIDARDGEVSGQ